MELAKVRKERGMTQEELAKLTGINRVSISRYEHGINIPSIGNIRKLCKVFNVSMDYLIGGESCEVTDNRADG